MAYYLFYSKGIIDAKIKIVVADGQVPLIEYTWAVIMIRVSNYIWQNITQYASSTMSWCKMLKNQLFLWGSLKKIGTSHIFIDAIFQMLAHI